jgi:putative ABC transport system permease protein
MFTLDLLETIRLGLKNLLLHKLRSGLTVLGVVFGVCSVVAMLSIGAGASYEAQEQIKKLGSNNIILTSVKPPVEQQTSTSEASLLQYGLTYEDAERIALNIPGVQVLVPLREVHKKLWNGARNVPGAVFATVPWFPETANIRLLRGRFLNVLDMRDVSNVCVISQSVARELLPMMDPLGQTIKVAEHFFTVVGVAADRQVITLSHKEGAPPPIPYQLYIPFTTGLERFPELQIERDQSSMKAERVQLHQITIKVDNTERVLSAARIVENTIASYHPKHDYEVEVPRALLEQVKAQQRIWNVVLGSIAAISLLVGGIGIMNIMLATVTERTREIGIRRALGAKKRAITTQFLVETVVLSGFGGILGLGVGITVTVMVTRFTKIATILTGSVLFLPFTIALAIGLVFGIYPAWQAANMDPIEALRHE